MSSQSILVISTKWRNRSLLAAQIGEGTGQDVVSVSGVNEALSLIKLRGIDPVLLVVDAGQSISRQGVERLLEARRDVPLVAIVSGAEREAYDSLRDRCAACLMRPVSIGTVAEVVAQLLDELP